MVRDIKTVIAEQRAALEKDEVQYRMAKRLIEDPEEVLKFLGSLKDRMVTLMTYNPDTQPAHSAVAVVASMKERLGGVFQDLEFLRDYEERKKEYAANVKAHVGIEDELDNPGEGSKA